MVIQQVVELSLFLLGRGVHTAQEGEAGPE
jgi:hypothetical protein